MILDEEILDTEIFHRHQWLSESIASDLLLISSGSGSKERKQTCAALFSAQRLCLTNNFTKVADKLAYFKTKSLTLKLNIPPILWIEYSPKARDSMNEISIPNRAGILLIRDPNDENIVILMSGWSEDINQDKVGLYPCIVRWNFNSVKNLNWSEDPVGDIISTAEFGMSSGMSEDIHFKEKLLDADFNKDKKSAYWRVSQEIGFATAVLSLLETSQASFEDIEDERSRDENSFDVDIKNPSKLIKFLLKLMKIDEVIWQNPIGKPVYNEFN